MLGYVRMVTNWPFVRSNRAKDISATQNRLYEIQMEQEDVLSHLLELQIKENVLKLRLKRLEDG